MNVKGLIILLLVLILVGGGGYGFSVFKRNRILNSGRPVLLINQDEGFYTYSNYIKTDDIDGNWKISGYLDELSMSEVNRLTEGLSFSGGIAEAVNQLGGGSIEIEQPEENEKEAWLNLLGTLTPAQTELCKVMPTSDSSQYCLARHIMYQAILSNQDSSVCDGLFVDQHKEECVNAIETGDRSGFPDRDSDGLLDTFEIYADPDMRLENPREFFGV